MCCKLFRSILSINLITRINHALVGRGGGIELDENGAFWVEIRCRQCPQVKNAVSRVEDSLQPIRGRMWCEGRSGDARFSFHKINGGLCSSTLRTPLNTKSKLRYGKSSLHCAIACELLCLLLINPLPCQQVRVNTEASAACMLTSLQPPGSALRGCFTFFLWVSETEVLYRRSNFSCVPLKKEKKISNNSLLLHN